MKTFICHYRTHSGDTCKLSVLARDAQDAAAQCFSATSYRPFKVEA